MGKGKNLSREQLEEMNDVLLDMCLHFCGSQYTEAILRDRGFGDKELSDVGFEADGEWADMDACMEV